MRMCVLLAWLDVSLSTFPLPLELVHTRNNIKRPHFSIPSSIPNASN